MKDKYRKENLEPIVKNSRNWTEILRKMELTTTGCNRDTLKKYCVLHNISISHFESKMERYKRVNGEIGKIKRIPLSEILVENSTYKTNHLKERLYCKFLKPRECEECGQGEEWRGKKMSLILDHKNGINNDNRLENLRIVCPNCNATLDTHCGKLSNEERIKRLNNKKIKNNENFIKRTKNSRKINRPPYEQLKKEIEELGYSATGRKYNVSDNAIRKWIKFYEKYELQT